MKNNKREIDEPCFILPDSENIVCKKCVYGWFTYYLAKHCAKYANKPNDVYYNGANCPKFKQSKKTLGGN